MLNLPNAVRVKLVFKLAGEEITDQGHRHLFSLREIKVIVRVDEHGRRVRRRKQFAVLVLSGLDDEAVSGDRRTATAGEIDDLVLDDYANYVFIYFRHSRIITKLPFAEKGSYPQVSGKVVAPCGRGDKNLKPL